GLLCPNSGKPATLVSVLESWQPCVCLASVRLRPRLNRPLYKCLRYTLAALSLRPFNRRVCLQAFRTSISSRPHHRAETPTASLPLWAIKLIDLWAWSWKSVVAAYCQVNSKGSGRRTRSLHSRRHSE